jgi:hypothetical protein
MRAPGTRGARAARYAGAWGRAAGTRARRGPFLLVAALLAAGAGPARALPMPDLMLEFGRSFAVDSGQEGVFDEGGFSLAASALWPVSRIRTGLTLFADDLGELTTELVDNSVSPPQPLGTFHVAHVAVAGALWRMEVEGPRIAGLETFGRGDWGLFRFRADQFGSQIDSESKLGWSLGGGVMVPVKAGHSFGLTFNFHRTFHEFFRDYMSAAAAWHWRPNRSPRTSSPKR